MNEQIFNTRIIHKHDTEANWSKATNFIPKQGELIVYDIDSEHNYSRIKIGDGVKTVINLPFIDKPVVDIMNNIISVPVSTVGDNGKFLRVVNGAAAWATVPNAEEATF